MPAGDEEADRIAADVVATYIANIANVELVQRLGAAYGVRVLNYWQPSIFTKQHPIAYETRQIRYADVIGRMYQKANLRIAELPEGRFMDIGGLLDRREEGLFIDWCHLTEKGNEQIARRMMVEVLQAQTDGRSQP